MLDLYKDTLHLTTAAFVLLVFHQAAVQAAPAGHVISASKDIRIDYTEKPSALTMVYGVDRGPQCQGVPPFTPWDGKNPQDNGADTSDALHSMGASVIRTHGSGQLDWEKLFPHPNLDVATDDPSNYDFTAGDAWLQRVVRKGFAPYFRLGAGQFTPGAGLPPPGIEYNKTALIDVMLHIVMHYSEGWGGGNFSSHGVRYFEIFNEPDSSCSWHSRAGCGQFWNRTASDFYDLFDGIARAIKSYDPTLKVGGPGAALADEGPGSPWPNKDPNPFSFGLIDAISTRRTPVDFFSWHFYTSNSELLTTIASAMQRKLDSVGLQHVEQHVTEWFTGMLNPSENTLGDAAAVAGILTKMAWANISLATMYPDCDGGEGKTGNTGWGLFDQESHPGAVTWRPLTHAYAAFGELAQMTPMLLPVTVGGLDETATYTVLAGRSNAAIPGAKQRMRVLISSQVSKDTSVAMTVSGVGKSTWQWSVSVIDEANSRQPATVAGGAQYVVDGNLVLSFPLVAPAVALVRMETIAPSGALASAHHGM